MGANIKFRSYSIGTSGVATGVQYFQGSGALLGLTVDFNASAAAGTIVAAYDGPGSGGDLIFTTTGNTDFGTTVPVRTFQNGRLVAGTSTNNVAMGNPFFDGLWIQATADTTGPQVVGAFWRPLIRVEGQIDTAGGAGSAVGGVQLIPGGKCGRFAAARVTFGAVPAATNDITFYDGTSSSGRALTTVANSATNWAASANEAVVTTTGADETGAAVTTAAGAYTNDGILFYNGLYVALAQSDALTNAATVKALVEL